MLQSEVRIVAFDAHHQAALQALSSGISQDELMTSLRIAVENHRASQIPMPLLGFEPCEAETVFDELPEGLVDVVTAAENLGISDRTIRTWIRRKHIHSYGRLRGPAPGGGVVLVKECEISDHLAAPKSRGGRPRKRKPE